MATRNIVPRATGEGSLGTSAKHWGNIYADNGTIAGRNIANDGAMLTTHEAEITNLQSQVTTLEHAYAGAKAAATVADMTDHNQIYVYVGSETGYTNGNWYYWNGTAWTSGGVYNATALETDKTLTVSGAAADAKSVGIKLNNVCRYKDKLITRGKNLFNKQTTIDGYLLNDRGLEVSSDSSTSDFIEVSPNTSYHFFSTSEEKTICEYDDNKEYIRNTYFYNRDDITTTANTKYVRVYVKTRSKDETQFEEGTAYTGYEEYHEEIGGELFNKNSEINGESLADKSIDGRKADFLELGNNLFDKTKIFQNTYLYATGEFAGETPSISGYYVTDFIRIKPSHKYSITKAEQLAFYDENKKIISGSISGNETFVTPSNSMYLRFSNSMGWIDNICLTAGEFKVGSYNEEYHSNIGDKLWVQAMSLAEHDMKGNKLNLFKVGKNLFNKNSAHTPAYLYDSGQVVFIDNYFVSDYIAVDPTKTYSINAAERLITYDSDKTVITSRVGVYGKITLDEGTAYIRFTNNISRLDSNIVCEGLDLGYEPFNYVPNTALLSSGINQRPRLYSITEAWANWSHDEKFPIGIMGDSTTDGANTSQGGNLHEVQDNAAGGWGKVDYINPYAYPYLLQELIKKELKVSNCRIYNMAYTGTYLSWLLPKLDAILDNVYADVKMIGITYGINDRLHFPNGYVGTELGFYMEFRKNLITLINKLYYKGIQPFLITSQATIEPYTEFPEHALRTSESIESIANRVKFELANEYNLEIFDMTKFDEIALEYSSVPIPTICEDGLHFEDYGHELEAGYLFSEFCRRVIKVEDSVDISFANQHIKSKVPSNKVSYLPNRVNGFGVYANYTKDDSEDMLLQDFWIFNKGHGKLYVKAFCNDVNNQYVELDDVRTAITSTEQVIGQIDIGLHHIVAMTGVDSAANWLGFKIYRSL